MNKKIVIFLSTIFVLISVTVIAIMAARGYTVNFPEKEINKTGMILAQSTPTDAKIYLNGRLVETTNAVLDSIPPGTHDLEISREGFTVWKKEIEVYEGLVTEVDALLVPTSPRLNPMISTGVELAKTSPSGEKIAFTSRNSTPPGLWILELTSPSLLNVIQDNPRLLATDTNIRIYSLADDLIWGPKETSLLITLNPRGHIVINTRRGQQEEATTSAEPTLEEWEEENLEQRLEWFNKLEIEEGREEELKELALDSDTKWSPDKKRMLFTKEDETHKEWHIYNGEKPLGIGNERYYIAFKKEKDSMTRISWYTTSKHLVIQEENGISVIDMNGENRKEVYSGDLDNTFPVTVTPDGTNIIILTSFKENGQPNLYALGLR